MSGLAGSNIQEMKMGFVDNALDKLGDWIAMRLETPSSGYEPFTPSDPETLRRILQPGDILLVEGNQKISAAIKYLTQSTWSHAALYIGDAMREPGMQNDFGGNCLIEVELGVGCVAVPLSKYETYNTRICRPINLTPEDRETVIQFMIDHIGIKYDTRNIIDLARYLFPTPPVPVRWRRRFLQLGSGEPTRAICSTLIAKAFQKVHYPILPNIERRSGQRRATSFYSRREILQIRHHSLFTPRDFDLSPFFQIIKPTIEYGFDYKRVRWAKQKKTEPEVGETIKTSANDNSEPLDNPKG